MQRCCFRWQGTWWGHKWFCRKVWGGFPQWLWKINIPPSKLRAFWRRSGLSHGSLSMFINEMLNIEVCITCIIHCTYMKSLRRQRCQTHLLLTGLHYTKCPCTVYIFTFLLFFHQCRVCFTTSLKTKPNTLYAFFSVFFMACVFVWTFLELFRCRILDNPN